MKTAAGVKKNTKQAKDTYEGAKKRLLSLRKSCFEFKKASWFTGRNC